MSKSSGHRQGDGEGLSEYLIEQTKKKAKINAFKDITAGGDKAATVEQLASTEVFKSIKKMMIFVKVLMTLVFRMKLENEL